MEIKGKKKTLEGIFLRYVVMLCITTLLSAVGITLAIVCVAAMGLILPANYAEVYLAENEEQIREAGKNVEPLLPDGCSYGLYNSQGAWMGGSFSEQAQENAWECYQKGRIYDSHGGYYRFIPKESGDVCIVSYRIQMCYSIKALNRWLPAPEPFGIFLMVVLFVLNLILLSRKFAGKLRIELEKLRGVTDKISENDLEFEAVPSEIREVNEVMMSLTHMKEALQRSLQEQWDMEKQKQEQLSALTHDVKTPLTVIRGNAELLQESPLGAEDMESVSHILSNVKDIEQYLGDMRSVLHGWEQKEEQRQISSGKLAELFREAASQISMAWKIPVSFETGPDFGEVLCSVDRMLRAFRNIVSNGAEYTDKQKGIHISIRQREKEKQVYLTVSIRDHGAGFTARDLRHAHEEFYSGDVSRHDRNHQGMGLFIAKRFMEEQGGFLEYGNCPMGDGAEVVMWIKEEFSSIFYPKTPQPL